MLKERSAPLVHGNLRIVMCEPREFIGRWSEATGSFGLCVPQLEAPQAAHRVRDVVHDVLIGSFALLIIVSVPGLILFATLR